MSKIPAVTVGSIWTDLDPRRGWAWRLLKVMVIQRWNGNGHDYATVISSRDGGATWGTRKTKIRLERFRPEVRDYLLMREAS